MIKKNIFLMKLFIKDDAMCSFRQKQSTVPLKCLEK